MVLGCFFMVRAWFSCFFMVPGGFSWFFMVPRWFFMVPSGFSSFFIGFHGSRLVFMVFHQNVPAQTVSWPNDPV